VSKQSLPTVTIPASDRRRLEKLARVAAEHGDTDALFLMAEINRAETISERAAGLDSIVTMGSWVTFWVNWGFPPETRQLVYDEEHVSDGSHIPVLSPLGAALIGLRIGSEMPFLAAGCTNLVRVQAVRRTEPNVIPLLFRRPVRDADSFDNDPGPRSA
jgi:regulator of nucleoside diphosphate kinase